MKSDRNRTRAVAIAPALLLVAGCALAAGCVRTDDGSVTVARQLDVGRYWRRPPPPPQTPPVQSGTEVFPVVPTASGRSRPARIRTHAARQDTPARPLACRTEFQDGQRAKVVCE